ncbi:MAG: hypothetical protein O3A00_26595 [Planctomycetota bacterium]|nr:hypothetical protein [Planctomycetota bacterium]
MSNKTTHRLDIAMAFGLVLMVAGVYGYDAIIEHAPNPDAAQSLLVGTPNVVSPKESMSPTHSDDSVGKTRPQTATPPSMPLDTRIRRIDDTERQSTPSTDTATKPVPETQSKPVPDTTKPPVPEAVAPKPQLEWTLERGQTLFQLVSVDQQSMFNIQGLQQATMLKYRVLSRFDVLEHLADGTRTLKQTILDARLDQADPLARATIGSAANAMKGRVFEITLAANMDVTSFKGQNVQAQVAPVAGLGAQAFMMSSLIDTDGWKELAQITFFQPTVDVTKQPTWQRDMRHDWGPLGSWIGKTNFQFKGEANGVATFDYAHDMRYTAPTGNVGNLPFKISQAQFQPQQAAGSITFDKQTGRVTRAAERFHVRGTLGTALLGQDVRINLDDKQSFDIQVSDVNPGIRP